MLADLIKLALKGMPNRSGIYLARALLITFALALRNIFSSKNVKFQANKIKSEIWDTIILWLQFQIKYIHPKDYARCPAILAVAGGYASPLDLSNVSTNTYDLENADRMASYFARGFRGYEHQDYKNWILGVTACIRKAEDLSGESILSEEMAVVEIGAGMGGILGLAKLNNATCYYSYDFREMQHIQRYIGDFMSIPHNFLRFHTVNANNKELKISVPNTKYSLFAFWSFTEVNLEERIHYFKLIKRAETTIITCNKNFEGADNFLFLEKMSQILGLRAQYVEFVEIFGTKIPKYLQAHRLYVLK